MKDNSLFDTGKSKWVAAYPFSHGEKGPVYFFVEDSNTGGVFTVAMGDKFSALCNSMPTYQHY